MTKEQIDLVLESVRTWPRQDQEELAEVAREIEARRTGIRVLTEDERAAITRALASPIASDEEVAAFWKQLGVV
ncbi:MAG: hypothetical protein ACREHE_06015 [Rhizomicrobium sp.]